MSRESIPEEPERVVIRDNRKIDPKTGEARKPAGDAAGAASAAPAAAAVADDASRTVDAALLEERTADLQRVQAEYANYRKRAERERLAAGDLAVGRVLVEFLPILDDLDRAAAHGDLEIGPLKAIADKLNGVFEKLRLEPFGTVGDPFDPALHEAVMHEEGGDVTEPTCTSILRKGYRYRDRLLRPAMVGVTDPASPPAAAAEDAPSTNGSRPDAEVGEAADREQAAQSEPSEANATATESGEATQPESANKNE